MSVCGQTEEESSSEEPPGAGAPLRDMYEQKAVSKVVRVLTVLAYLLSVSLAAILLSVYYVCVWQSPKLPPVNDTDDGHSSAMVADPPHNLTNATDFTRHATQTGGGNSTVSEAMTSPPADLTSIPADSEPPDLPPSSLFDNTFEDFNVTSTASTNDTVTATDQR